LQSEYIDYSDIELIVINVLGLVIQSVFFAYGLVHSLRGSLSPKRMGIVIAAFFHPCALRALLIFPKMQHGRC